MGARSFPRLAAFLCYAGLGPSFQVTTLCPIARPKGSRHSHPFPL